MNKSVALILIVSAISAGLLFQNCSNTKVAFSNGSLSSSAESLGNTGGSSSTGNDPANGVGSGAGSDSGGASSSSTTGPDSGSNGNGSPGSVVNNPSSVSTTPTVETIQQNCQYGTLKQTVIQVNFPSPGKCAWGLNNNLTQRDGFIQARQEQSFPLALPMGSTICGLDFAFPTQSMTYDDQIMLTFDDVVVLSSYKPIVDAFPLDGTLPIYDWPSIKGANKDPGGYSPYCVGQNEGLSTCTIPKTQTTGQIQLSLSPTLLYQIAAQRTLTNPSPSFGFITTGDNDDKTDCQHTDVSFSVLVNYY